MTRPTNCLGAVTVAAGALAALALGVRSIVVIVPPPEAPAAAMDSTAKPTGVAAAAPRRPRSSDAVGCERVERRSTLSPHHEWPLFSQLLAHVQREVERARLRLNKSFRRSSAALEARRNYELRVAEAHLAGLRAGNWARGEVPVHRGNEPWLLVRRFARPGQNGTVSMHWWPALDDAERHDLAAEHASVLVAEFNTRSPTFRRRVLARRAGDPDASARSHWLPETAGFNPATATAHLRDAR